MHRKLLRPLLYFVMTPSFVAAQTLAPAAHESARTASPPAPGYQSAFSGYKPYRDPVPMSWRQANDQVRDAGGMHGHDTATAKSQSDPHAGHDMAKTGTRVPSSSTGAPHAAKNLPVADPHAGHDKAKTPPAMPAPGRAAVKAPPADPHAGHDMSKMHPPAPAGQAKSKKERE